MGELIRPGVELTVRQPLALEDYRDGAGVFFRLRLEALVEGRGVGVPA
jgi:hypothetical protein